MSDFLTVFLSYGSATLTFTSPLTWQVMGLVIGTCFVFDIAINSFGTLWSKRLSNILSVIRKEGGLQNEEELPESILELVNFKPKECGETSSNIKSRVNVAKMNEEKRLKYLHLDNTSKVSEKDKKKLNISNINDVDFVLVNEKDKDNQKKETRMKEQELSDIIKDKSY